MRSSVCQCWRGSFELKRNSFRTSTVGICAFHVVEQWKQRVGCMYQYEGGGWKGHVGYILNSP